jgi:V/A-type H+-transporting ATPase subunit F
MAAHAESVGQEKNCKILILTEQAADWVGDELTEWQLSGAYPLVVELPGLGGKIAGRKSLVDSIREAIGIHV